MHSFNHIKGTCQSSTVQHHSIYSLGKALIFTADYSQHIRSCSLLTVTVVDSRHVPPLDVFTTQFVVEFDSDTLYHCRNVMTVTTSNGCSHKTNLRLYLLNSGTYTCMQ